ncbi:DNA-processing protein DprA [Deinococcus roseus]|uniref:Smf/DprA SLOG domain-containing protein n=1 Tax=Deinococcus roseus TaxID=392414 RepID=A0ABQ2D696_9DEIO|nr:DNA-processing protein DprA [Deinococcus roseus]GGJ42788.1 hypothetical protein GCM10008938_31200 [Deinococcus roseus]
MTSAISGVTLKILTLLELPKVGQQTVKKLLQYPHLQATQDLQELGFLDPRLYQALSQPQVLQQASENVQKLQEQADQQGMQVFSLLDPQYPDLLRTSSDAPLLLYLQGNWEATDRHFTVVGTRTPTRHGEITCERITRHFVQQGFGVVAALVPGCASIGLQTALQEEVPSVAVLAAGLDQPLAPALNRMIDQILQQGGTLISPFPPGTVFRNHQQVQRDRLMTLLGLGVLLVQSGLDGTSVHPLKIALQENRPVAVPALSQRDQQDAAEVTALNQKLFLQDPQVASVLDLTEQQIQHILLLHGKEDYTRFEEQMGFAEMSLKN